MVDGQSRIVLRLIEAATSQMAITEPVACSHLRVVEPAETALPVWSVRVDDKFEQSGATLELTLLVENGSDARERDELAVDVLCTLAQQDQPFRGGERLSGIRTSIRTDV